MSDFSNERQKAMEQRYAHILEQDLEALEKMALFYESRGLTEKAAQLWNQIDMVRRFNDKRNAA